MTKKRKLPKSEQSGTTPATTPQMNSEVANLSLPEPAQFSMSVGNCRNCESSRVITIEKAALVAPFFAARVFGIKGDAAAELRLDAALCTDCLFLTHSARIPEDNIMKLYEGYRDALYNAERIMYEPGYSLISEAIGSTIEISTRNEGLDAYIDRLVDSKVICFDAVRHALDWGGAKGGYAPRKVVESCEEVQIFDISHNSEKANHVTSKTSPGRKSKKAGKAKYDYIQFCHVLEHLQDPLIIVKEMADLYLNPSGYIYIEVPIEEAMEEFGPRLATTPDQFYVVHEHINKYCLRSIRALVESINCLTLLDLKEDTANVGWSFPGFNEDGKVRIIRCLCQKL
jgi:SAM-dependent methyltransferase